MSHYFIIVQDLIPSSDVRLVTNAFQVIRQLAHHNVGISSRSRGFVLGRGNGQRYDHLNPSTRTYLSHQDCLLGLADDNPSILRMMGSVSPFQRRITPAGIHLFSTQQLFPISLQTHEFRSGERDTVGCPAEGIVLTESSSSSKAKLTLSFTGLREGSLDQEILLGLG